MIFHDLPRSAAGALGHARACESQDFRQVLVRDTREAASDLAKCLHTRWRPGGQASSTLMKILTDVKVVAKLAQNRRVRARQGKWVVKTTAPKKAVAASKSVGSLVVAQICLKL